MVAGDRSATGSTPITCDRQNSIKANKRWNLVRDQGIGLERVITKALEKDKAVRYQHASEMKADLMRARRDSTSGSGLIQPPESRQSSGAGRRKLKGAAGLVAAVAAALITLLFYRNHGVTPANDVAKQATIAVLPFQNLGSDKDTDFLRLALPDEIATTLSYVRTLSIRPFATASKYTGPSLDLQQAGREMRVKNIVTGHFLKAGSQLQVTLEAVDVENDRVFWQGTLSAAAGDMVSMREQITAKVRQGLVPALGGAAESTDTETRPRNEEAYDLYLRSLALMDGPKEGVSYRLTVRTLEEARQAVHNLKAKSVDFIKVHNELPPARRSLR